MSNGTSYSCKHCGMTFATRNKLFDHLRGRNGAQGCIEAIKKGVQQDIQMARVGMHFGYFGHALCRSSKNYTIEFSNDLKADKPVYTFNSGKDEYTLDATASAGDITKLNSDQVMRILLQAMKSAVKELSLLLNLGEDQITSITLKIVQSMSRATAISSRKSYHYRADERTSASSDFLSCTLPTFALAKSSSDERENFVHRLNRHIDNIMLKTPKLDTHALRVFSVIPLKASVHAVHDRKFLSKLLLQVT